MDDPRTSDGLFFDESLDTYQDTIVKSYVTTLFNSPGRDTDLFISENSFIKVDSGVESVWGWEFDLGISDTQFKNWVLGLSTPPELTYSIQPIHIVDSPFIPGAKMSITGGGTPTTNSLPLDSKTKLTKATIQVKALENAGDFNPPTFTVERIAASWDQKNTIEVCLDTSQVVTPTIGGC